MSTLKQATERHAQRSAMAVETVGLTKRFGQLMALDTVSLKVQPGTLHALLGENGAGKSTLVKCLMGVYRADGGQLIIDNREQEIPHPRAALASGLGMVYQHFTLVPSLNATENLIINRHDCPAVIRWRREKEALNAFLATMPFEIPMDVPVAQLASGQKQKLEIIKQLYLGSRFLVLDEPTSVLTPAEADEVLNLVKTLCNDNRLTVLMITHKFREVSAYADTVSVLRQGRYVGGGSVVDMTHQHMADMMMGTQTATKPAVLRRRDSAAFTDSAAVDNNRLHPLLVMRNVKAYAKNQTLPISIDELNVEAGEIVGIAGVSGNGQSELMELLTGQRAMTSGSMLVDGKPYTASRQQARDAGVRYVPEEPLHNACAARMSVADNIAFRTYDVNAMGTGSFWLDQSAMRAQASQLACAFNVKAASLDAPMESLSGGNVQRAVLARELTGKVKLLIVSNPCFGLDFSAVTQIRQRILAARNEGTGVLLISEDLDEILQLSDRIVVMSEGSINYSCSAEHADMATIGHYMAGQVSAPDANDGPWIHEQMINIGTTNTTNLTADSRQ